MHGLYVFCRTVFHAWMPAFIEKNKKKTKTAMDMDSAITGFAFETRQIATLKDAIAHTAADQY